MREKLLFWMGSRFPAEERNEHAAWVMESPDRLEMLWDIFETAEPPVPQRVAWTLDKVFDTNTAILQPYVGRLAGRLNALKHDGEKRSAMRILAGLILPEEVIGPLFEVAFTWFENPLVAVAIRVHCMQVLYNISEKEPELKRELLIAFQAHYADGSPAYKARARKLIKKLSRETGILLPAN
ncbi:MAG TPA: hypothetical protein ENJ82_10995 [Bacteroidetes bacterium]|nr:hypothetical protein [Bacteroidota bacterium]